jgi:hypothetical protein
MGIFNKILAKISKEASNDKTNKMEGRDNLGKPIGDSAHDLIKIAKKQKKEGDLQGAIKTFRKAYYINKKEREGVAPAAFLQLPLYLQAAGRNDEGWIEFNKLLTDDWTGVSYLNLEASYSNIYDKMRIFLQREKRAIDAVPYGVISHIMDGVFNYNMWKYYEKKKAKIGNKYEKKSCDLFIKNYRDVYSRLCSEEFLPILKDKFTPLLKKAQKLDCMDAILKITQTHLKKLPKLKIQGIYSEIEGVLHQ